jgi:peptidoglycan/LPS O-acetylase OafA/YrhL
MYVFNKPIIAALWLVVFRFELPAILGPAGCLVALYVAAVLLSYGAALASWLLLESPCLGFKRYFETPAVPSPTPEDAR